MPGTRLQILGEIDVIGTRALHSLVVMRVFAVTTLLGLARTTFVGVKFRWSNLVRMQAFESEFCFDCTIRT